MKKRNYIPTSLTIVKCSNYFFSNFYDKLQEIICIALWKL